jgi:hypothetical protein
MAVWPDALKVLAAFAAHDITAAEVLAKVLASLSWLDTLCFASQNWIPDQVRDDKAIVRDDKVIARDDKAIVRDDKVIARDDRAIVRDDRVIDCIGMVNTCSKS